METRLMEMTVNQMNMWYVGMMMSGESQAVKDRVARQYDRELRRRGL